MNADLVYRVANINHNNGGGGHEEIDSILSPEYLRLVNNQSELRANDRKEEVLVEAGSGGGATGD